MPLPVDGALAELHVALDHQRLVIVQAPPGTGKTKTILGILSVLLASESSRPHRHVRMARSCDGL